MKFPLEKWPDTLWSYQFNLVHKLKPFSTVLKWWWTIVQYWDMQKLKKKSKDC